MTQSILLLFQQINNTTISCKTSTGADTSDYKLHFLNKRVESDFYVIVSYGVLELGGVAKFVYNKNARMEEFLQWEQAIKARVGLRRMLGCKRLRNTIVVLKEHEK